MIGDHFEDQRADFVLMADQREQQAVGVVESGAVELAVVQVRQFLDLRCAEVVGGDCVDDFAVGLGDARGVEADVFKDAHGVS